MIDGETKAKLNGAIRDALKKDKVPFVEVSTQVLEGDVVVITIVTPAESRPAASKAFAEVAKRHKGKELRCELKSPEELAQEKAATLRLILQALTSGEPYTVESIAERAKEQSWVIVTCLKALVTKGILEHVGEYEDNPVWKIEKKYATYEQALSAARDKGFDVG